ncbi:MAG: transport system ATP-binding/permease protein [Chthoniobacter sp.]|jgi:ABC-type multidrug transport system ATPase subunit|nr:transport system ATP-binding/permease protein [Chthoniobacter sp.]
MISRLSLLDQENGVAATFDLDQLSDRRSGQARPVTLGGPGSIVEIEAAGLIEEHICLTWISRASSWAISSKGPPGDVTVNKVPLRPAESRTLSVSSCVITCANLALLLERRPAPPLFEGQPRAEVPIPERGLIIGRGTENRQGDPRPRLALDPEIFAISSVQAEVEREPDGIYLVNHKGHPKFRTKLNGDQGFSRHRLVFGDCIQIPDYDYYTFQFNGTSLVHIGEGGAIQARGLVRETGEGLRILSDVDLDLQCGDFVGVLGGSGQGKSTLMKAVCGMAPAQKGAVWIEGRRILSPADMTKTGIGYVPQEDIVHRELTVRQALRYGAKLRVSLPPRQLEEAVDTVLETLSLTEHQFKQVRVLSGGQCKRVSIASELLMNPRFLFLDEPTSGLDPQTESELMTELSVLARNKRMGILCTTHVLQNSHLFKAIIWVHGGRIIFLGRSAKAVSYFLMGNHGNSSAASGGGSANQTATLGTSRSMPALSSPLTIKDDELLSKLPKVYGELGRVVNRRAERIRMESAAGALLTAREIDARIADELADEFAHSGLQPHLLPIHERSAAAGLPTGSPRRPRWWKVLSVLCARQSKILVSDPLNYLFLLAQAIVIGTLVGWVSENLVFQMFISVIATLWFGCSNGAQQIVGELPIFRRERLAGVGLNTYVVSKLLFQTAITAAQALLLFFAVLCTDHWFHPEVLPTAERPDSAADRKIFAQLFFSNRPEFMNPAAVLPETAAPAAAPEDDFLVSAPGYTPPPEETVTNYRNPTGLTAGDPQFKLLERIAWFFRMKENVLDELGVKRGAAAPSSAISPEKPRSWVGFVATLLALRFGPLMAAAVTGVALGLLVSASVRTVTQAVMWVPLILIPQILFGGFVVTSPEMSRPVIWFSTLLPSYNLQRLMDTANLYGRNAPQITNKTKIPAFLAPAPYEEETVRFRNTFGSQMEKYDKLSEVSKSWQNLTVYRNIVGERFKEPDRDTVEIRRDVLFPQGISYKLTGPAIASWLILSGWLAGCYLLVLVNLTGKQASQ